MINENIGGFVRLLIKVTKQDEVEWIPIDFYNNNEIEKIDREILNECDTLSSSHNIKAFILKKESGYVLIVSFKDSINENINNVKLFVKANSLVPLIDMTEYLNTKANNNRLKYLMICVEERVEREKLFPDVLYDFMRRMFEKYN